MGRTVSKAFVNTSLQVNWSLSKRVNFLSNIAYSYISSMEEYRMCLFAFLAKTSLRKLYLGLTSSVKYQHNHPGRKVIHDPTHVERKAVVSDVV